MSNLKEFWKRIKSDPKGFFLAILEGISDVPWVFWL